MGDLDLRRLRYFLALADTLNYGRAADLLHIAQPALSRSIAALERELGVTLFERSRAGTRLAPAGEVLREEAEELLRAARTLRRRLLVADREGRSVTIGFVPGLVLAPVVRHLEERFPGLRVHVVRTSWRDQITALAEGRFDAAIVQRPFDADGLTVVSLHSERRVAVLPVRHPHAGRAGIALADLAGSVLLQPAETVPEWGGSTSCQGSATVAPLFEETFEHVAAGRGIVVVPESGARFYHHPDLTVVPVIDLPAAEICLVVEARRRSAVLRELMAAAPALIAHPAGLTHVDAASVQA